MPRRDACLLLACVKRIRDWRLRIGFIAGFGLAALTGFRGYIALLGTIAYVAFFSLGAGAVPGLLVPEITPAQLRGSVQLPLELSRPLGESMPQRQSGEPRVIELFEA